MVWVIGLRRYFIFMTEIVTDQQNLITVIDKRSKIRLVHPVVTYLYHAFVSEGILATASRILETIPKPSQDPIIHTLTTHVTKEKPLFVYSLATSVGASKPDSTLLAASVDILWALALMYDDIEDNDFKRAGVDASWVVYGKEKTLQATRDGLQSTVSALGFSFGQQVAERCMHYVQQGLESIAEHRVLTLYHPLTEVIENYVKRAYFHTAFPVEALDIVLGLGFIKQPSLIALNEVNLAGQILNDTKDFTSERFFGRESYRDIKNGLVTVSIKLLWDELDSQQRSRFSTIFGKGTINASEKLVLDEIIGRPGILFQLRSIMQTRYQISLENFQKVVTKSRLSVWFERWVDYKLEQVEQVCIR